MAPLAGPAGRLGAGGRGGAAYHYSRSCLLVDNGVVPAGVLLVLGGGSEERPQRAAELFHQGAAPMILCTGQGDGLERRLYFRQQAIARSRLAWEPLSRSTLENAQFTVAWLRPHHCQSAIIVTTWYHSRRALACFQNAGPGFHFYARPAYWGYAPVAAMRVEVEALAFKEFFKIPYYWAAYGVPPWLAAEPGRARP